jgi:uncharacterized protein (DUF433 family)
MNTIQSINLITINPAVRNGYPCVIDTAITVADIAAVKIYQRMDGDDLADYFDLSLSHIYATLAYFYEHKQEIDEDIRQQQQLAAEMKEKRVGSRHKPLFG